MQKKIILTNNEAAKLVKWLQQDNVRDYILKDQQKLYDKIITQIYPEDKILQNLL